jgi:hypothetical protein
MSRWQYTQMPPLKKMPKHTLELGYTERKNAKSIFLVTTYEIRASDQLFGVICSIQSKPNLLDVFS